MKFSLLIIFIFISTTYSCDTITNPSSEQPMVSKLTSELEAKSSHSLVDSSAMLSYNLDQPTKVLALPGKLMEISGLSYHPTKHQLLAIHDEKGFIYFINKETGKIEETVDFGKRGDYEGVEKVGNKIYVIKSNGTLSVFDLDKNKPEEKIKTPLSLTNDVEGLGYLESEHALLIACKGKASIDKDEKIKKTKAFYQFNLTDQKFIEEPWLLVTDESLVKRVKQHFPKEKHSKKFIEKLKDRVKTFSPSGIAVHPITQHIYILSSQGKTLLEFSPQKELHALHFLDKKHAQPEGICFSPEGDLFISNEGKGLSPKIFIYEKK